MAEFSDKVAPTEPSTSYSTLWPMTTPFPSIEETVKCNQYVVKNKTHLVYGGYEGIPENLLINFIGWICLLSLFTILRKKAWNYGRLAIVQKYDNRKKGQRLGYSEYNV